MWNKESAQLWEQESIRRVRSRSKKTQEDRSRLKGVGMILTPDMKIVKRT